MPSDEGKRQRNMDYHFCTDHSSPMCFCKFRKPGNVPILGPEKTFSDTYEDWSGGIPTKSQEGLIH